MTSDTAAENSCSQKCGTRPAAIRLIACTRPPTIRIQPRNQVSASDDDQRIDDRDEPATIKSAAWIRTRSMLAHRLAHRALGSGRVDTRGSVMLGNPRVARPAPPGGAIRRRGRAAVNRMLATAASTRNRFRPASRCARQSATATAMGAADARRDRRRPPPQASHRPERPAASGERPVGRATAVWRSFSGLGVVLGALFLAASLTPSLIPRTFLLQGVLGRHLLRASATASASALLWLWTYLQLPIPSRRLRRNATWAARGRRRVVVVAFSWRAAEWQNSIRERIDMPPVHTGHPLEVMAIAAARRLVLILLGRLFRWRCEPRPPLARRATSPSASRSSSASSSRSRCSAASSTACSIRAFLNAADNSFATRDALLEPDYPRPTDPLGTGSAASLVDWEDLGRAGREFVASGPTPEQIAAFTGRPAERPLRVYVGLELRRDHRGPREACPRRADPRRRLRPRGARRRRADRHRLDGPGGDGHARVPARRRHRHRRPAVLLPDELDLAPRRARLRHRHRPRPVPRRLRPLDRRCRATPGRGSTCTASRLGAYGSEQSARLHEMIDDPFQGALWSGPPFPSPIWSAVTRARNPGTPEWLPTYGDGSIVRFTNQENAPRHPRRHLGADPHRLPPVRQRPDHLLHPRRALAEARLDERSPRPRRLARAALVPGRDAACSSASTWRSPLAVPIGHGHYYAPQHYVDAWVAVTDPQAGRRPKSTG